ncbi:MAG: YggS family pyridoxal phosphate-dependent enzyme [Candidatus Pelagibacter sp.]
MHESVQNLINIKNLINSNLSDLNFLDRSPKIIAVSKTFKLDHILPLIEYGHDHFGENKVQEAIDKWSDIKKNKNNLKIHLIGKLQTNKVKHAIKLFDFIHSLDSEKLANKISVEQKKLQTKPKIFIQINIGNESQKSGIRINELEEFYKYCLKLDLDIIGTMCLPPINEDPERYFMRMSYLNKKLNLNDISMGMSSDYLEAIKYNSTYLRLGTKIFGKRTL